MLLFGILECKYSQCNHYLSNRFDVGAAFWAFKGNSDILHRRCVVLIVLFVSGATNRLNNKRRPIICRMLSIILCLVRLFIVFGDKLTRSPSEWRKIVRIDIFSAVCPWLIPRRGRMSHAPRSRGAGRCSTRFMVSRIWSGTLEVGCRATGGRRNLLLSSDSGIADMITTRRRDTLISPSFDDFWFLTTAPLPSGGTTDPSDGHSRGARRAYLHPTPLVTSGER